MPNIAAYPVLVRQCLMVAFPVLVNQCLTALLPPTADPLPLMDLSRRAIRLAVGKQRLHRLSELNLPPTVIDYLHFKDRTT